MASGTMAGSVAEPDDVELPRRLVWIKHYLEAGEEELADEMGWDGKSTVEQVTAALEKVLSSTKDGEHSGGAPTPEHVPSPKAPPKKAPKANIQEITIRRPPGWSLGVGMQFSPGKAVFLVTEVDREGLCHGLLRVGDAITYVNDDRLSSEHERAKQQIINAGTEFKLRLVRLPEDHVVQNAASAFVRAGQKARAPQREDGASTRVEGSKWDLLRAKRGGGPSSSSSVSLLDVLTQGGLRASTGADAPEGNAPSAPPVKLNEFLSASRREKRSGLPPPTYPIEGVLYKLVASSSKRRLVRAISGSSYRMRRVRIAASGHIYTSENEDLQAQLENAGSIPAPDRVEWTLLGQIVAVKEVQVRNELEILTTGTTGGRKPRHFFRADTLESFELWRHRFFHVLQLISATAELLAQAT